MQRYGDLESSPGRSGLWRNYTEPANEGGVLQIDDFTLQFQLQSPSAAFIKYLALDYVKVLPKHLLERGIDLKLAENIIDFQSGSGPFVLDEYIRGNLYRVSRNPNYFKEGRPFFDSIDHIIFTEANVAAAAFITGQIDMSNSGFTNLSPIQSLQVERRTNGASRVVGTSPSTNWGLMMNVEKQPFDDARVRQAIQLAIDYQQWNDMVFDGTSAMGCPFMGLAHSFEECANWPGLRPKDTPGGQEDLAIARELMAEAGYPDGFQTRYDIRSVSSYAEQCSVVQQQLKDVLGIEGEITIRSNAELNSIFSASRPAGSEGEWELACQGQGQAVSDVDEIIGNFYLKGASRNYTDWESRFGNTKFEEQKVEIDPAKRREINKELELFLYSQRDNHWITLGWGVFMWIVSEDIRGFNAPQTLHSNLKHEDLWLDR